MNYKEILKEHLLKESMDHVSQISLDIQHDGSEDAYNYIDQIASEIGWELENAYDNIRLVGSDVIDITDTYKSQYGELFTAGD